MTYDDFSGLLLAPVVVGLVQVFKPWLPDQFKPVLALVFGIILSLIVSMARHQDPVLGALVGVAVGLSAAGLYSGTQAIRGK